MRAGFRWTMPSRTAEFEKRSNRRQFAGNRGFFQIVIVKVRHELANQQVRDFR